MELQIRTEELLYLFAGLSAVIGLLLFGLNPPTSLSPFTVLTALFILFSGFLFAGLGASSPLLEKEFAVLALAGYISGLLYIENVFKPGSMTVLKLFFGSSALFAGLAALSNRIKPLARKNYRAGLLLFVFLVTVTLLFEFSGGSTEKTLNLDSSVNLSGDRSTRIGSVIAHNNFDLPRIIETGNYRACVYRVDRKRVVAGIEKEDIRILKGNEVRNIVLKLDLTDVFEEEEDTASFEGSFNVTQRKDCPLSSSKRKIVVSKETS